MFELLFEVSVVFGLALALVALYRQREANADQLAVITAMAKQLGPLRDRAQAAEAVLEAQKQQRLAASRKATAAAAARRAEVA